MKIKVYYNKNLKMSKGKLAAQVGHVCLNLGMYSSYSFMFEKPENKIIVLGLRKNKFDEKLKEIQESDNFFKYVQKDLGFTEVDKGTITCFGHIE